MNIRTLSNDEERRIAHAYNPLGVQNTTRAQSRLGLWSLETKTQLKDPDYMLALIRFPYCQKKNAHFTVAMYNWQQ